MRKKLKQGKGYILCHIRRVSDNSSEEIQQMLSSENRLLFNNPNLNPGTPNSGNTIERQIFINYNNSPIFFNQEIDRTKKIEPEIKEGYKEFTKSLSILASQFRLPNGCLDFSKIFSLISK